MNYFEYFGFPIRFDLDIRQLRTAYYSKSKSLHPDLTKTSNVATSELQSASAFNNLAYESLLNPISRLEYSIILSWGKIENENQILDPHFLSEMMDFHENIDSLKYNPDSNLLQNLKAELAGIQKATWEEYQSYINLFDQGDRSESLRQQLIQFYFKLKYFKRLDQYMEGDQVDL